MEELNKRHDELSEKIFKMGFALHEEGIENDDETITHIGDFMVLISGLIHDEDDVYLFGQLCSMFSAKKILDAQISMGEMTPKSEEELNEMLRKLKDRFDSDDEEDGDEGDLGNDLGDELK